MTTLRRPPENHVCKLYGGSTLGISYYLLARYA
jgi:hypothetical protein